MTGFSPAHLTLRDAILELVVAYVETRTAQLPRSFDSLRMIVAEVSTACLGGLSHGIGLIFDADERGKLIEAANRDLPRLAHQRSIEMQAVQARMASAEVRS